MKGKYWNEKEERKNGVNMGRLIVGGGRKLKEGKRWEEKVREGRIDRRGGRERRGRGRGGEGAACGMKGSMEV